MKVYIVVDMEGATGVSAFDDVLFNKPPYNSARIRLTQDVNAAIEGAIEAGATEILVNECHDRGTNLVLEKLHPKARVIRGDKGKKHLYVEGIDESFDKVFLVGFHARAGTMNAVLNHSFNLKVHNFWINDVLMGEVGVAATLAGYYGVPVSLVTGDDKAILELSELVPGVIGAEVKKSISRFVADCLSSEKTFSLIKEAAKKAMRKHVEPYRVSSPVMMKVEFISPEMGHAACLVPGIELVSPRIISCTGDSVLSSWYVIRAGMKLASIADHQI